jgi:mannose-6-phosphate isomerase-like protein (cupin superfamily)
MRTSTLAFLAGLTLGAAGASAPLRNLALALPTPPAPDADVEQMLEDFVDDYRTDATARPITFGIEVRDASPARWHVVVGDEDESGVRSVQLELDFPIDPAPYFTTDLETLGRIHRGELASLTAMGKAYSTDFAPLDMEVQPGFQPEEGVMEHLVQASFHFWTRGFPERVPFGDLRYTRPMHGANGTLFYYQEGFRSGFFHLQPGDHVNAEEAMQTNPFPSLLIVTEGRMTARIGDTTCELAGGEAVYVGPGVHHEFWVDEGAGEGGQGVLVMFGDGA